MVHINRRYKPWPFVIVLAATVLILSCTASRHHPAQTTSLASLRAARSFAGADETRRYTLASGYVRAAATGACFRRTVPEGADEVTPAPRRHGIHMDDIPCDVPQSASVELRNTYDRPFDLRLLSDAAAPFAVQLEPLDPGFRYRLTVTTQPPLRPGMHRAKLRLDTGIAELPAVTVNVFATTRRDE